MHHFNSVQHGPRRWCGAQLEHSQEFRRVAAQRVELFTDQVQVIERLGLGELIGIGDALREIVPRDDRLDGGVRISARLFGLQQGMADLGVQPYLVVDRLALFLELLLMFVLGGLNS